MPNAPTSAPERIAFRRVAFFAGLCGGIALGSGAVAAVAVYAMWQTMSDDARLGLHIRHIVDIEDFRVIIDHLDTMKSTLQTIELQNEALKAAAQ